MPLSSVIECSESSGLLEFCLAHYAGLEFDVLTEEIDISAAENR